MPVGRYLCYKRDAPVTWRNLMLDFQCPLYREGVAGLSPKEYDEITASLEREARYMVEAQFREKIERSSRRATILAIVAIALAVLGIALALYFGLVA